MKEDKRKQIQIEDESVVEIDYKTLHPAMLYAKAGADLPEESYAIDGWPRSLVKVAFLILVNAKSKRDARLAIAHDECMSEVAVKGTNDALAAADKLIGMIKGMHKPIVKFFHCDIGAELMLWDSRLAEKVMHRMLRNNVLVLPVHDSFLVPKSKAEVLEQAMRDVADQAGIPSVRLSRSN